LVDDESGVASDIEPLDPKLDCDMETVDKGLILRRIVLGGEVESDCISHPYPEGRDEDEASSGPGFHQRPVEVQGPALVLDLGWRELGSRPLSYEIR